VGHIVTITTKATEDTRDWYAERGRSLVAGAARSGGRDAVAPAPGGSELQLRANARGGRRRGRAANHPRPAHPGLRGAWPRAPGSATSRPRC
jgi:hypothetical protein